MSTAGGCVCASVERYLLTAGDGSGAVLDRNLALRRHELADIQRRHAECGRDVTVPRGSSHRLYPGLAHFHRRHVQLQLCLSKETPLPVRRTLLAHLIVMECAVQFCSAPLQFRPLVIIFIHQTW